MQLGREKVIVTWEESQMKIIIINKSQDMLEGEEYNRQRKIQHVMKSRNPKARDTVSFRDV